MASEQGIVTVFVRLTPSQADDLEQVQDYLHEQIGRVGIIPRSTAVVASIQHFAYEIRRIRREEAEERE